MGGGMKYFFAACCIACCVSAIGFRRDGDTVSAIYRMCQAIVIMLCYRKEDD